MANRNLIVKLPSAHRPTLKDKIKFFIHPSFILLFLWFIIFLSFYDFLMFVGVVLTHELGHALQAKRLGYKLDSFFIAPYGVKLNYKDKCFDSKDEIKIALAGPMVNLVLAILAVSLWWIAPVTYVYLDEFVLQSIMLCLVNLVLAILAVSLWWIAPVTYVYLDEFVLQSIMLCLVNLLPCYPLDGGRIFVCLMSGKMPRKKAVKISCQLNYVFSAILFIIFIATCFYNFNPSICLFAVFLILGSIDSKFESRYVSLFFKRKIKNFSRVSMLCVDDNVTISSLLKHIEPNKHTIFAITRQGKRTHLIDEEDIKALAIKYPITDKIKDVIRQEKE